MQEETLKCPDCRKEVPASDIKSHVRECVQYPKRFLNQTLQITEYMNSSYLPFFMSQLDLVKEYVEKLMLKEKGLKKQQEPLQRKELGVQLKAGKADTFDLGDEGDELNLRDTGKSENGIANNKQLAKAETIETHKVNGVQTAISKQTENMVECENCKTKLKEDDFSDFIYADICLHLLCMKCVKGYIHGQFVNHDGYLTCLAKECKDAIPEYQIKELIGDDEFTLLTKKVTAKAMGYLTVCVKCKEAFQFISGNPKDAPKQDYQGKPILPTKCQHYAKNRFMCPNSACKQQQCKGCGAMPFHLGFDCKQYKLKKNSKKCRYCDEILKSGNKSSKGIKSLDDICNQKECTEKVSKACTKVGPCKHPCFGFIGEKQCLPCLNEQCAKKNEKLLGQDSGAFCSVCFIQGLSAMPCVMSKCGHIYHYQCLQKQLNIRWLTPRIIFSFCTCPVCKAWIELPPECPLSEKLNYFKELHRSIQEKSLERLKYQGNDKDQKVTDKKSAYYQKPGEYAMAIYAYFQCWKCKKPYFGGRKKCADVMNDRVNPSDYNPKDLVCPKCCPVSSSDCPKHGTEFVEFKCKFCCSIAQWFCFGNTHFCEQCHQKAGKIEKVPKDKLPKCQGPGKCASGGKHSGNGKELCLGCALCKDFKESGKEF